jgi:hypothetical protein
MTSDEDEPPSGKVNFWNALFEISSITSYFLEGYGSLNSLCFGLLKSNNNRKIYKPLNIATFMTNKNKSGLEREVVKTPLMNLFGENYGRHRELLSKYLNHKRDPTSISTDEKTELRGYLTQIGDFIYESTSQKLTREDGQVEIANGIRMDEIAKSYEKLHGAKNLESMEIGEMKNVAPYQDYLNKYLTERTGGIGLREASSSYNILKTL